MPRCFAGIDVSRKSLAVAVIDISGQLREFSADNNAAGHREVIRRLSRRSEVLVVLEATSTYSLDLFVALHHSGIQVSLINPSQAHNFKGASARRAKTDPLDAAGLAHFGRQMQPRPSIPPSANSMLLRQIARRMAELSALLTAEKNRRGASSASTIYEPLQPSHSRMAKAIEQEIGELEQQAMELLRSDEALSHTFDLVTSVCGVAKRSGISIVGEYSCLPAGLSKRQVVSFFGLDPQVFESGTSVKGSTRISRRGSPYMRRTLYMVALVACRFQPEIKTWYEARTARGMPPRKALVALMRRLICTTWGMLKNDECFIAQKF
jgi:transposase